MVHTGSVSIGHASGTYYRDKIREIHPANSKYPDNGIFVLPIGPGHAEAAQSFWDAMHSSDDSVHSDERGLSPSEYAARNGLSLSTVHRRLRAGLIKECQSGGKNCRIVIPPSELFRVDSLEADSNPLETHSMEEQPKKQLAGPKPKWSQRTNKY